MFVAVALLPIIILYLIYQNNKLSWRGALITSLVAWGAIVTFLTEFLSLFNALAFVPVLLFWVIINTILIFVYIKTRKPRNILLNNFSDEHRIKISSYFRILIASIIGIIVLVSLIALVAPPNNWDSMTYHMARVEHWIQNQNVNHYPTAIPRQLYQGPWSGFAITQLQILAKSDRFANIVQLISMIGSVVGVSLIAKQFEAKIKGQIFASVFCATIPMGILQSSSTQNDYVVSFWLVSFIYFLILSIKDKFNTQIYTINTGICLGLAMLTKGTAYIYALPFLIWLAIASYKLLSKKFWRPLVITGILALTFNVKHFLRNFQTFGSIFGASDDYTNQLVSPGVITSNIIRNLALHFSTPVRSINLITINIVDKLHQTIGLDVNDPRTTFPPNQKFDLHSLINHEDLAGNPIHMIIILVLLVFSPFLFRKFKGQEKNLLINYFLFTLLGFGLFCTLLTWSPWRSRLHLPLFVIFSAIAGSMLTKFRQKNLVNIVMLTLIASSSLWIFFNETRPIILNSKFVESGKISNIFNTDRYSQYFVSMPDLKNSFAKGASLIENRGCQNVGLVFDGLNWEYPIWVSFKDKVWIEHIQVDNNSKTYFQNQRYDDFIPCALISNKKEDSGKDQLFYQNLTYDRVSESQGLAVFIERNYPKKIS